MKLKFTKMHGAGNDFVVLDGYTQPVNLTPAQVRALADRHFGVGADQLLLVEKPTVDGVDFRYRIFNCDGGEVEHCGNGARCFVKFVRDNGLTDKRSVRVQVQNGTIQLTMQENGEVLVDMGAPVFEPERVPFAAKGLEGRREGADTLLAARRERRDALDFGGVDGQSARGASGRRRRRFSGARRRSGDRAACTLPAASERGLHADRRTVARSSCGSTNAAPARRWRAARARARPSRPAFAAGCWMRRCRCTRTAAS